MSNISKDKWGTGEVTIEGGDKVYFINELQLDSFSAGAAIVTKTGNPSVKYFAFSEKVEYSGYYDLIQTRIYQNQFQQRTGTHSDNGFVWSDWELQGSLKELDEEMESIIEYVIREVTEAEIDSIRSGIVIVTRTEMPSLNIRKYVLFAQQNMTALNNYDLEQYRIIDGVIEGRTGSCYQPIGETEWEYEWEDWEKIYYTKSEIDSFLTLKQDKTDNSLQTSSKTVVEAINEVKTIAAGASFAVVFDSYSDLIDYFNDEADPEKFKVGTNVYIRTLNVPDIWISEVESASSVYNYVDDETFIDDMDSGDAICGFYKFNALETGKVDLTNYVQKTDYASASSAGVVKLGSAFGININGSGQIFVDRASNALIDAKSNVFCPIVPSNLDYAVKKGLTDNSETLTAQEKTAIKNWLDIGDTFRKATVSCSAKTSDIVEWMNDIDFSSIESYNAGAPVLLTLSYTDALDNECRMVGVLELYESQEYPKYTSYQRFTVADAGQKYIFEREYHADFMEEPYWTNWVQKNETWTFTKSDNTTVTKDVVLW